jgi:hypothetical protein
MTQNISYMGHNTTGFSESFGANYLVSLCLNHLTKFEGLALFCGSAIPHVWPLQKAIEQLVIETDGYMNIEVVIKLSTFGIYGGMVLFDFVTAVFGRNCDVFAGIQHFPSGTLDYTVKAHKIFSVDDPNYDRRVINPFRSHRYMRSTTHTTGTVRIVTSVANYTGRVGSIVTRQTFDASTGKVFRGDDFVAGLRVFTKLIETLLVKARQALQADNKETDNNVF